jgi:hypothetical protein
MRRGSLESFVGGLERWVVAMEACGGAHHLGRVFVGQGHAVRLMSPEYVRPYVKAQKNDELDAEAIVEAATRPTMRFVEVKSQAQSDVQALHRASERLVSERTALIDHLRALLLERGIVVPQHRPGDTRQLVGQRYDDDVLVRPRQQSARPPAEWRLSFDKVRQHGPSAVDQILPKIPIAALGDAEQARLAAGRHLARPQSEPGRRVPSACKSSSVADGGSQRGGIDRSDPRNRDQAAYGFVFPRHADELRIKGSNPLVERPPLAPQVFNQSADAGAQCLDPVLVGKACDFLFQFASSARLHI